jgi:transcriptional regulator with XRE-family HTH domain
VDELDAKKRKNGAYSLRAFAKHIGVSASTLSRMIAGSRAISLTTAARIAAKLGLEESETDRFLYSVVLDRERLKVEPKSPVGHIDPNADLVRETLKVFYEGGRPREIIISDIFTFAPEQEQGLAAKSKDWLATISDDQFVNAMPGDGQRYYTCMFIAVAKKFPRPQPAEVTTDLTTLHS